jgi:hypothetical protein
MITAIHQPDYLPWMGYFYKIYKSDRFVFLDDAQYSNNGMHNWNDIKTPQGRLRLKIPVKQNLGDKISDVVTKDDLGWKRKHLRAIEMNYSRAPYFKTIFPKFKELLLNQYDNLAEMNEAIIHFFCEEFSFKTDFVCSFDMGLASVKEERVIDICAALGATIYFSGNGASSYQDASHFAERGIKLVYSDFSPVEYRQLWNGFIPGLSALDYVLNCGFTWPFADAAR